MQSPEIRRSGRFGKDLTWIQSGRADNAAADDAIGLCGEPVHPTVGQPAEQTPPEFD
ncbi:MAG: hypothetical protein ACLTF6_13650 [Clostridium sp.]